MITQSTTYATPPAAVVNLILSKVGPFDDYIILCDGTNSYAALVKTPFGDVTQYNVVRYTSGVNTNYWRLTSLSVSSFDYSVSNEYYVYSSVGIGTMQVPPSVEYVQSWAMMGIVCFCAAMVVFPYLARRLFKCHKR